MRKDPEKAKRTGRAPVLAALLLVLALPPSLAADDAGTAAVAGRVVDAGGRPVAGADVFLVDDSRNNIHQMWARNNPPRFGARSDAGGRFRFDDFGATGRDGRFALPDASAGTFDLEIKAPGYVPRSVLCDVPGGTGAFDLGTVELGPAASVVGLVTADDGRAGRSPGRRST